MIRTFFDISNFHIAEHDATLLGGKATKPYRYAGEYGWFVWIPESDEVQEAVGKLAALGYSEAFCNLISHASKIGCDYALFDADGTIHEGFPTFDW